MNRLLSIAAAFAFLTVNAQPSAAQDKGAASVLTSSDYVGMWLGATDWRGIDGYDNPGAGWDFRSDGTLSDDQNNAGVWSVGADGYISFQYATGGQARYTGTIVGSMLLGTMTTASGDYSGVFAMRRLVPE